MLETTKAAQDKNGLRHHDYLRYRQYCCRKLRRIRRGKQIKLTHGRGRRYTQRVVTADMVTEERCVWHCVESLCACFESHLLGFLVMFCGLVVLCGRVVPCCGSHLHIPLFNAERAWSYAMQLKQDDQLEDNPRLRFHLVKRLRKAAEWAANLKQLCRERCDECVACLLVSCDQIAHRHGLRGSPPTRRTYLEAHAYCEWMHGTYYLEREEWSQAYESFERARMIYEQVGAMSASGTAVASVCLTVTIRDGCGSALNPLVCLDAAPAADQGWLPRPKEHVHVPSRRYPA